MAMTPENRTDAGDEQVAPLARHFLWADSPKRVHSVIVGLSVLCVLLFLMDFVWHRHTKVPGESFYGFYAIAGFVSFTLIVLGARALRELIRRDESFYGEHGVDSEAYPAEGTQRLPHDQYEEDNLSSLWSEMLGRKKPAGNANDEPKS